MVIKKKNCTFTLTGLDFQRINRLYKFQVCGPEEKNLEPEVTNLFEEETVVVNDFVKGEHQCKISLIYKGEYNCFWCHRKIEEEQVQCPLKYFPDIKKENYNSVVADEVLQKVIYLDSGVYQTDGAFCGYPCCFAFINENAGNPIYNDSKTLLYKFHRDLTGKELGDVDASPHWRQLKSYGGNLTMEEFHKDDKIYIYHGFLKDIQIRPICHLYEAKKKIV